MTRNIEKEAGQSLVEFAIVLPLMATVLLLIGYFGKATVDRQKLLIAARLGARERAIASLNDAGDVFAGKGILIQASGGNADAMCKQALGNLEFRSEVPNWQIASAFLPTPVGTHGMAYLLSKELGATITDLSGKPEGSFTIHAGIGFLLYGQKLSATVAGIDAFGGSLSNLWGGKFPGLSISSTTYMPGGLPAHQVNGAGVLELNPWIGEILNDPEP